MAQSRFLPIASTTKQGIITTGAQTLAGLKTFQDGIISSKRITSAVVTLTDGATPALDASLGNTFYLSSTQNPTIAVPTNAVNGQRIIILFKATSANRTLALNTGAGGFAFGTDIPALSTTTSGLTDAIGCVYHSTMSKWLVVAYVKGFS